MLQKQPKSFSLQENVIFIISFKSPDVNPTEDASFYWKKKLNVGRPLPEVSSCLKGAFPPHFCQVLAHRRSRDCWSFLSVNVGSSV